MIKTQLFDADIIVYRSAYVSEKEGYDINQAFNLVDNLIHDWSFTDNHKFFLSGKNNFRYDVAVTHPYKGHRKDKEKPPHFDSIRKYMIEVYGAVVSDGEEADDLLGKNQKDNTTCICTTDKDLDQIPGWHYNLTNRRKYWITPEKGLMFFYKQMLTGDNADNIKGLYRVGPKTADSWLEGLTPDEAKQLVKERYQEYEGELWEQRLKENAQLLWIRR